MPSPTGEFKLKGLLNLDSPQSSQVTSGPLYLIGVRTMVAFQTSEDFASMWYTMEFAMEDGSVHEIKITKELVEEMHDNTETQVAFQQMVAKTLTEKIDKAMEDLFVNGCGPPGLQSEKPVTVAPSLILYPFTPGQHTEAPMNTTTDKDTIEFMRQRPHARARDLSKVPCTTIAQAMQERIGKTIAQTLVKPEPRAVQFYLFNHAASILEERYGPKEPLPPKPWQLFEAYHYFLNKAVIEAAYYLILICTREIRHGKNIIGKQNAKIFESYSPEVQKFFQSIPGDSQEAQMKFRQAPPDVHLGQWTDFMERGFFVSGWGGSYGGKKWGEIAKQLNLWVHGHISGIGLLDVIWALCHNGGPIFNKGMIYNSYNGSRLKMILDVQRAGFMPQYVLEGNTKDTETAKIMDLALGACGPELTGLGYVDWFSVEATGVGTYGPQCEKQTMKHGQPVSVGGQEKNDLLAELLDTAQAAQAGQWTAKTFNLKGTTFGMVVPVS